MSQTIANQIIAEYESGDITAKDAINKAVKIATVVAKDGPMADLLDRIVTRYCTYFSLTANVLLTKSRTGNISLARLCIAYAANKYGVSNMTIAMRISPAYNASTVWQLVNSAKADVTTKTGVFSHLLQNGDI